MSRIGKKPIEIPQNVTFSFDEFTRIATVKGPLGELTHRVHPDTSIAYADNVVTIDIKNIDDRKQQALWGTTRAILANLVLGVSKGFTKTVELNGVGFRMELNKNLVLYIGFSHPVNVEIPSGLKLALNKNVLSGESADKQLIGDFFTKIHDMKPCDVYKQKGFKFPGRFYRKKVGKKGK